MKVWTHIIFILGISSFFIRWMPSHSNANERCELPLFEGTLQPYPQPEPYPEFPKDEQGHTVLTEQVLLNSIDNDVIHGIVREKPGGCSLIVEAVIDSGVDKVTLEKKKKKALFKIQVVKSTQIDNVPKYPEDMPSDFKPSKQTLNDIAIGDVVIAFAKRGQNILSEPGFTATRVSKQNARYWQGIAPIFGSVGVFP